MKMLKDGKRNGTNQYIVRDSEDDFVGHLFRFYNPYNLFTGNSEANYDWLLDIDLAYSEDKGLWGDCVIGQEFDTFKEAKEWLEENII